MDQAQDMASRRSELEKPTPPVVQTQTDTGTPSDTDMNTDTSHMAFMETGLIGHHVTPT